MHRLLEFFGLDGSEIGRWLFGRPRRGAGGLSQLVQVYPNLEWLETRVVPSASIENAKPFWDNGHYYAVTHANAGWGNGYEESRATTLSQLGITGYLATVTSAEENAFIANYATGRSDPSQPNYGGTALQWRAFLAGVDPNDMGTWEGKWQWYTGEGNPDHGVVFRDAGTNYGYSNWESRQPDNKGNEDFLVMNPGGGWNDVAWKYSDYVTEWGRAGVEFNAGFAALGASGTRNGAENGQAATMTIRFDRHVPSDYVDIRYGTPLIDIPITFGGTATYGTDYDMTVSGGESFFRDGRLYVRNTQSVLLTFTPRDNDTWQAPRTITAALGADGSENIYGISGNATSQVWIFDDEPLLSLGQGAYQFIRAPYTAGSSQTLPANNADFNTNADTLIFDTDGIQETEARFNEQGFYDSFAMRWESYVRIPETGSYRFRTWSDDGSILTVRRNNGTGVELASISDWEVGGGRGGVTSPISLQEGDVVWIRLDSFEAGGAGYTHLNWDRPDGNGGTITDQPIPGTAMFLSEALAHGVNRSESPTSDSTSLGFQLFANQPSSDTVNVETFVYSFTAGGAGWNTPTGTAPTFFDSPLGTYLGRFANGPKSNGQDVWTQLSLAGNGGVVAFTFNRLDSWDAEAFRVFANGVEVLSQTFNAFSPMIDGLQATGSDGYSWSIVPRTYDTNLNAWHWTDQVFEVQIRVPVGVTSLTLGFGSTLDQAADDESWGIDDFRLNEISSGLLNVRLASTSEASNSTVETSLAQRRADSTRVGDDYALVVGGSQITTDTIGMNDAWGTLQWQPNKAAGSLQNLQTFDVLVLNDSFAEATESINLKLGTNAGYGVSNNSQTLNIRDNPIVLSVRAGKNPREGAGDEGDLGWFTVSTNGRVAPAGGLRVRYAITGGTATRNADFTAPQATLSTTSYRAEDIVVVPAGATEARIYIAALADAIREGDETLTLELLTNVEADNQNFRFQRYNIDAAARQATLTIHDTAAYAAAVVTTPADRTGLGTVRAQLTGGQQVAIFDVHVTSQPRADVVVTLATTSGSLSTRQLTFTSSNWTQPQRVTLTGPRTDQISTVSVTTASSDQQYGSLATQQRIVPSNWASELELSLWEGGVRLAAQPAASVESFDGTEGSASRFGFELSLGSPAVGSPVELLYTLSGRDGFTVEGDSPDARHEAEATYRPLVLTNATSGSAAFVNLGSLTTVSGAGEFSAQAWVRRDRAEGGDTVLEFSNASGQHQIWLGFPDTTNQPRLQFRSSSGAVLAQLTSDTPLALLEWNHLAFSIDGNKVASLYVNGELVARQTLSSGLSRLARSSNLLGRSLSSENRLAGAVRAVAIWNAARTKDEIRASMLDEKASGPGLVSSLPLNNSLANGVASAPAAVLSNGTTGNTASFATTPLYGLRLAVGAARVGVPLNVLDDPTAEGIKSLTLGLVGSGRYSIGGVSGTGTAELADNDTADVQFLAFWSNLDASSSGWTSTSQFRISEADQSTNTRTRLGIRLTSRPTADVRLSLRPNSNVRVSRPGQAGGSSLDLVFTPANWDQVQELLLQGVDDSRMDGDITRQLSFQVTSGDRAYSQLAPSLPVLVLDDDTLAVEDDPAAGQGGSAPFAVISAPSRSRIAESGADSADFTITLSAPAERDTLVFFDLEQSNRQLFASDISVTPSLNAQALKGLARFGSAPVAAAPIYATPGTNPFGIQGVGGRANPAFADADNDGDLDLFIGSDDGNTRYFRNTAAAGAAAPIYAQVVVNPFGIRGVGSRANPAFADADNDGDLDLFIGNFDGTIFFFRNTAAAGAAAPIYAAPGTNPFGISNVGRRANPEFADADNDGDLDLFIGNDDGNVRYFQNIAAAGASAPAYASPITNPFGIQGVGGRANPAFADADNDGDLDLFIGNNDGNTVFFRNIAKAGAAAPVFAAPGTNPFGIKDVGLLANPAFADADNDGDLDLFIGQTDGNILFFRNTAGPPPETVGVDLDGINETRSTFATAGQTGLFSTTWSGYLAIPETGFYRFSIPTQGGVRLTLDGKVVIDQMIDTRATWSTDLLQLNRGDFIPFSLDYQSFNTAEPSVALHWQRPTGNNTGSVSDPVPAEALSRVDGFHLLIARGSSSATVTVRGIDDAIDEADEALAVRLLNSRGVELVVTGQSDGTQGVSELAITLGITDRESVALPAGTVLDLGRSAAAAGAQRTTAARFRLSEAATVHRDRTTRLRGTLTWVDEATRTSLGGSVVNLVAGADGETYQILDRSVSLAVAGPLAADSATGQSRYLASLTLQPTNLGSVELAAGTRLAYVTKTTGETVTLVLVNSLTLQSGETKTAVAVSTEARSRDLDLTSAASPLVGLISRLKLSEVATLTITDDDQAGLRFSLDREGNRPVDGTRQTLWEQGDSLIRYVSLTSQPDDAVTVYLETNDASEARLQIPGSNPDPASARIAFTFTPEDWQTGQAFRIVPHDDRLVDGDQNVGIFSRTTSSDVFYAIPSAGRLDFVVRDNDTPGVLVELRQGSIPRAGNGFINLSLTAQPTANVLVTLTPSDHQFTINDRGVGRSETLVFTPENWSTLQTVGLYAVDDNLVEDLSTSTLRFSTTSSDARFNALPVDPVRIVITDNDLPTATLELVSDGNEDGRPGRFRIRLSEPAPASAGSKGVVVNYRVTAVGLDPALPYGSDVAGRLDKIVQWPAGMTGTVRIAPGQSVSDLLIVPIADFLADQPNKSVSVQLTGGDGYTVAADSNATSATVQIINNVVAGMLVMTSGERVLVKESGATATYQLALTSEPKSNVTVTITEKVPSGASRQLGTSSMAFGTTVTFTRGNWFIPQQVSVRAYDDLRIEDGSGATASTGIHPAELSYSFSSDDTDYNTASHTGEPWHFTNTVQRVDVLDYELSDKTATAMQAALTTLQEGIDSLALPIVGSLDGKTGQGLRKFIVNLTNSIRQIRTPTPKKLSGLISREIASALGVPEQAVRVDVSMKDVTSGNPAVVVRFSFADEYTVYRVPLAADFGLPGLGFQTQGSFDATFSYQAGLEIVFPRSGEIYLSTGGGQTFIRASYNAGLTDTFRLTGGMGLMQLDAVNQPSVNGNVKIGGQPASTELDVGFVLTVGGGAGGDAKLTFTELTSSSLDLEQVFQYGLSGNAAMSLGVTTSVAGQAAIPSFTFDLSALLPLFDYSNQAAAAATATSIYFDNIRLDLGSFITDLLDPIVGGLDDILKPLYPLVDALYSDTQIFATVGLAQTFDVDRDGKTSAIDLSRWFANFYARIDSERGQKLKANVDSTVEFLDLLKGVMDLVRDLERLSDEENFYIDYGSYELAAFPAGSQESDPADVEVDESSTPHLSSNTKQQADAGGTNAQSGRPNSSFQKMMGKTNELGFRFPLMEDPVNVVKLLLGQDVSLFEWQMPQMGMTSEIEEYYPIFAGVEGVIRGGFEVKAHLGFGFDTYGLTQWRRDAFAPGDAWKVFNGFYLADLDEHGRDVPEFSMDASMGAGLGYNARVVRSDITGGLVAAARMDLLDEGEIAGTSDGKIRGQEITSRILNPLNLFELSGELTAYLKSQVKIGIDAGLFSIWKTVWEKTLAEIPIFAFGIGGRYGSGTVSNGHLAGTTIFFDANFNGRIDSLEPVAISDAEGHFDLQVDLRTFDTNRNGRIDDKEGRLVVFGGVDTTMDMPLALPFVAPLGSMVTPLTTIYSLSRESGVAHEEVDAFLRKAFGLGQFDYLNQDALRTLQEANSFADSATRDALATYLAHIRLHVMGDLVTGATQNLLPDLVPGDLAAELEILKGMLPVLLEKPDDWMVEDYLGEALHKVWLKLNPESDPKVTNMVAKVADLVSRASREVATRLDRLRADAFRTGASPAELLGKIHELKEKAFQLFRGELHGISAGLYRITNAEELDRAVTNRLQAVDSAFLEIPTSLSLVTANLSGQYTPNQPVVLFAEVVSISGESAPTGSVEFYLRGPAGGPDRKIGTAELSPLQTPDNNASRATYTANPAFDGNNPFSLSSHTVYALYVPPPGDEQPPVKYAVSESMSVGIVVQAGYDATRLNGMPLYDTDSVFGTAQKSRSHALVTGIFQGALGRMPGSAEADDWARRMDAGTLTPEMLTTAIHQSTEYLTKAVRSLYTQHLKREADETGLRGFLTLLHQGGTLGQVSAMILGSPEYRAAFADDRSWIHGVYRSVLGRDADASGLANWIKKLAAGSNHAEVALAIIQSAEGTANAIEAVYALYFGRNADPVGQSAWTAVAQEKGLLFALSRILSSEESLSMAGQAVLPE